MIASDPGTMNMYINQYLQVFKPVLHTSIYHIIPHSDTAGKPLNV